MEKENATNGKSVITNAHSRSAEKLAEDLDISLSKGLSDEEAKKRLKQYGPNELEEQEKKSLWSIFFAQLNNPVVYLLAAAAFVAFLFGDIPEAIAILVVIVLNTAIGFWMEYQARQSMEALKQMDRLMTKVLRSGNEVEIDATNLVPGDLIVLEAGALIPADARLTEVSELSVDEASLTGESVPIPKHTDKIEENLQVADRTNMVFKGTTVTNGNATAIVTATGMATQLGDISKMVHAEEEEQVPLTKKLEGLARRLIWLVLGLAALFFLFGWLAGQDLYRLVQTAIAWSIAAIPEGLPIVASIALARGMLRLADHNVIVKRLAAVETLGETNIIFTDKTGTLTKNVLTLDTIAVDDEKWKVNFSSENNNRSAHVYANSDEVKNDERLEKFYQISVLCNDASLEPIDNESSAQKEPATGEDGEGDPLDLALLTFGKHLDPNKYEELLGKQRLVEEPFDSDDMVMGVVYSLNDSTSLLSKGAPEAIIQRCSKVHSAEGVTDLDESRREKWMKKNDDLTDNGLRVIAFAYKELDTEPSEEADVEEDLMQDLIFLGLAGFIDPPAEHVREAIETCHSAGIKVAMVTGDHPGTARNVAKQVGILSEDNGRVISGGELKEMEEGELSQVLDTSIFARMDPRQKLVLIDYYRENGSIVGMTGDGVNDTPALKKADIGIAMGKRGTQAAKETADMVLTDDSFPSIVEAIREGRIIFGNIRKFIIYQLSYHLAEIILIAVVSFTVFQLPLMPLQLLFINLLSDVFPALALGIGRGTPEVMQHRPKEHDEPIINKQSWQDISLYGVVIAFFVTAAYFWAFKGWDLSPGVANNVAFFSLAFAQLLHVFNMRNDDESLFDNQVTQNKFVWMAISFCAVVLVAAYLIPGLRDVLSFQVLGLREWVLIAITSVCPLLLIQVWKQVRNGKLLNENTLKDNKAR